MSKCPCGSGKDFNHCCDPLLQGDCDAASPEALMRSRYMAYARKNLDYIKKTMRGAALRSFNLEEAKRWLNEVEYVNLRVINAVVPQPNDNIAFVEFCAKFRFQNEEKCLHEVSEFHKEDGRWFYVDGVLPKTGRNDPCPCGCGKKHKKCCGK